MNDKAQIPKFSYNHSVNSVVQLRDQWRNQMQTPSPLESAYYCQILNKTQMKTKALIFFKIKLKFFE